MHAVVGAAVGLLSPQLLSARWLLGLRRLGPDQPWRSRRYGGGQFLNRCCVEHRRRRCWLRHLIVGVGHARQSGMLTGQQALQRLAEIGQQMPAIRHLYGVRRATPCTFGVAATAIATDDLNTWMSLQPGRQRLAERSVSRSTTQRCSKSTRMVRKEWPFFQAQSSTPSTFGMAAGANSVWPETQQGVSMTGMACPVALRAPASPPYASPIWRWASARRVVRRAKLRTTPGSRSTKVRCWYAGLSQKKRRTLRCRRTCRPTHGNHRAAEYIGYAHALRPLHNSDSRAWSGTTSS